MSFGLKLGPARVMGSSRVCDPDRRKRSPESGPFLHIVRRVQNHKRFMGNPARALAVHRYYSTFTPHPSHILSFSSMRFRTKARTSSAAPRSRATRASLEGASTRTQEKSNLGTPQYHSLGTIAARVGHDTTALGP